MNPRSRPLSRPLVSVVVVNWNGRPHLERCLPALLAQTYRPVEVIVVDNGSSDGSASSVRRAFPGVQVREMAENLGFAAGSNEGIRCSRGTYVATLNNDTIPEPGWLAALVEAAESDPRVGLVASKMLFFDRPTIVNSAGICIDRAGIAWDRRGGQPDDPHEPPASVFGPCAGAALYRRAMLDDVGLFDEEFFCYLEDVDLAWRARLAGWECRYAPGARVLHHHSATSGEGSAFKRFHLGRNKVWLLAKNMDAVDLVRYLPIILGYDLIGLGTTLLSPRASVTNVAPRIAALVGRLAGIIRIGVALRARRQVKRRLTRQTMAPHFEPLVFPWQITPRYAHLTPRASRRAAAKGTP
ncbi:MAG: glycosyltransferase family 2 protein [Chloroflexi bacterium]|nr:glycosyltransferase family 2 protein [Chloroflexota bacterium]